MKLKYLSRQIRQFLLSTVFVLVAVVGVSLSNSFDQEYMAKVTQQEEVKKSVADISDENLEDEEDKSGVAMK